MILSIISFTCIVVYLPSVTGGIPNHDTGYPHDRGADKDSYQRDSRADKDSCPHDRSADKDSYPHDRHNQYIMLSL